MSRQPRSRSLNLDLVPLNGHVLVHVLGNHRSGAAGGRDWLRSYAQVSIHLHDRISVRFRTFVLGWHQEHPTSVGATCYGDGGGRVGDPSMIGRLTHILAASALAATLAGSITTSAQAIPLPVTSVQEIAGSAPTEQVRWRGGWGGFRGGGYGFRGYGGGGYGGGWRRPYYGGGALAAGLVGGLALGTLAASAGSYYGYPSYYGGYGYYPSSYYAPAYYGYSPYRRVYYRRAYYRPVYYRRAYVRPVYYRRAYYRPVYYRRAYWR